MGQFCDTCVLVIDWLEEGEVKEKDLFREGQICFSDRSSVDKRVMEIGRKKEPLKMQKYKKAYYE